MDFKIYLEQEWQRDMGMPNQLDNPTMDKALNNTIDSPDDGDSEPRNADPASIDNIHALENHTKALSRLIIRIVHSKKFFGMENDLKQIFQKFRNDMSAIIQKANGKKIQQPQVEPDSQGVPLNQQTSPEMAEKLRDEQPPTIGHRK